MSASTFSLNAKQYAWAQKIVARIKSKNYPADQGERIADIALEVCLAEGQLRMYANGNNPASLALPHDAVGWDHGSVGLFQQQVGGAVNSTANWGTTAQCMDVNYSTDKFVGALLGHDWLNMTNWAAAQATQGSAYDGNPRSANNNSSVYGGNYQAQDAKAIRLRTELWGATAPAKPVVKPPAKPAPKPTTPRTYKVVGGDTLGKIADRFGTSVSAIISRNRAKYPNIGTGPDDHVEAGWTLTLTGSAPAAKPSAAKTKAYTIRSGDNFWVLEDRYKWAHGTLQKLNPSANATNLQIGQSIRVPA